VEPKGSIYYKCTAAICSNKEFATDTLNFKLDFVVDVPNNQGVPATSLKEAPMY
jgi:hypothetical protein